MSQNTEPAFRKEGKGGKNLRGCGTISGGGLKCVLRHINDKMANGNPKGADSEMFHLIVEYLMLAY